MKSNTDYKPEDGFALLLVGPPLSGKTNVAMGMPTPYFVSTDKKLNNAVQRHPNKKFFYDYVNEDTETGVAVPIEKRWNRFVELAVKGIANPEVQTLVIDNLSDVSTYLTDFLLSQSSGKADTPLMIAGVKCMAQAHWRPFSHKISELIWSLRSFKKNLVVCCHEAAEKDEVTEVTNYRPAIGGEQKCKLASMFTDVWRCEIVQGVDNPVYKVRTAPTPRMNLGRSMDLPNMFNFSWEIVDAAMKKLSE